MCSNVYTFNILVSTSYFKLQSLGSTNKYKVAEIVTVKLEPILFKNPSLCVCPLTTHLYNQSALLSLTCCFTGMHLLIK